MGQLGLHAKPIGLLGTAYWDPLLAWLDRAVAEGFLAPTIAALLTADRTSSAARPVRCLGRRLSVGGPPTP